MERIKDKARKSLQLITLFTLLLPTSVSLAAPSIIDDPDKTPTNLTEVENLIDRLQNIVFALAGAFAVVMLIWGAIVLASAGGNEEKVAKGKKIITFAVGGIIIVLSAYAIVTFLIRFLGGGVS